MSDKNAKKIRKLYREGVKDFVKGEAAATHKKLVRANRILTAGLVLAGVVYVVSFILYLKAKTGL